MDGMFGVEYFGQGICSMAVGCGCNFEGFTFRKAAAWQWSVVTSLRALPLGRPSEGFNNNLNAGNSYPNSV
eukprot:1153546-Pelagomonas_calceolata.AAC.2